MIRIVSVARMREIEAAADASGLHYAQLMENAGQALATRAATLLAGRNRAQILVLVGAGNNGGDGLVAARLLAQQAGYRVCCYLLRPRPGDRLLDSSRNAGAEIVHAEDDLQLDKLDSSCGSADLVIDALLGIGLRLPLRTEVARLQVRVGQTLCLAPSTAGSRHPHTGKPSGGSRGQGTPGSSGGLPFRSGLRQRVPCRRNIAGR